MKILIVQEHCSRGGQTTFDLELARGLMAAGHQVLCFFFEDWGFFAQFARQCPAELGDTGAFCKRVASEAFDIVQGDGSMIDLPRLLNRSGFKGKSIVVGHAVDSTVGWLRSSIDAFVAVSQSSAVQLDGCTDLEVEVIPNGIDTEMFRPVPCAIPAKPIIAWSGRSSAEFKDLPRYARITRLLSREQYEFRVADADGAADPSAAHLTPDEVDHISSWRSYPRSELPEYYSQIAQSGGCLLVTSKGEPQGLVILEALACGCPVLAVRANGALDVLSGALDHWLIPTELPDNQAAEFVLDALQNIAADRPGEVIRDLVIREFSQSVMTRRYLSLYSRAASCSSRPVKHTSSQVSARLWDAGRERLQTRNRLRDALFIFRAAISLSPGSLRRPENFLLFVRCIHRSRLQASQHLMRQADAALREKKYSNCLRHISRALLLHPVGPLFS